MQTCQGLMHETLLKVTRWNVSPKWLLQKLDNVCHMHSSRDEHKQQSVSSAHCFWATSLELNHLGHTCLKLRLWTSCVEQLTLRKSILQVSSQMKFSRCSSYRHSVAIFTLKLPRGCGWGGGQYPEWLFRCMKLVSEDVDPLCKEKTLLKIKWFCHLKKTVSNRVYVGEHVMEMFLCVTLRCNGLYSCCVRVDLLVTLSVYKAGHSGGK